MNQAEIAETLCINKNTEKADKCKGCCYLDNTLDKLDDLPVESKQKENKTKVNQEEIIAIENQSLRMILPFSSQFYFGNLCVLSNQNSFEILDPPPRF